jgi:hypothetical protein
MSVRALSVLVGMAGRRLRRRRKLDDRPLEDLDYDRTRQLMCGGGNYTLADEIQSDSTGIRLADYVESLRSSRSSVRRADVSHAKIEHKAPQYKSKRQDIPRPVFTRTRHHF